MSAQLEFGSHRQLAKTGPKPDIPSMESSHNDHPAAVRQFLEALDTMHPGLSISWEKGGDKTGDWWMDIGHRHGSFTVHWQPGSGFGLHPRSDEAAFGELPPERYADTAMLLR